MTDQKHITVLLVDDEKKFLDPVSERIRLKGFAALPAESGEAALDIARKQKIDLAIVDHRMPGIDGLTTIAKLKELSPLMRTVLLTGYGNNKLREAAEALGADYFEKDKMVDFWQFIKQVSANNDMIIISPRHGRIASPAWPEAAWNKDVGQTAAPNIMSNGATSPTPLPQHSLMTRLIGESPGMRELKSTIRKVAPLDCSVLIVGETGTGKKRVAETIHQLSPRYAGPFIPVPCGTFTENLLGYKLHDNGRPDTPEVSYSPQKNIFGTAGGGTLLLDDIGNASAELQTALLQQLYYSGFIKADHYADALLDIRILAATDLSLSEKIASGDFQKDLYHHLNEVTLQIPPLRSRTEDIPLLSHYFFDLYRKELNKNIKQISDDVLNLLTHYDFPGNVRELKNAIKHAIILCEEDKITRAHLPGHLLQAAERVVPMDKSGLVTLAELEDQYIEKVILATHGNKSEAARILGINRASLWRKLKKSNATMENSQPVKLLIVDDDKKFLDTIAERLGLKDFDVATATEGKDAVQIAQNGSFDVAILDLNMPGMDGKELLATLKKNNEFLEAVMLTGFASIDSAVECTKLGAFGYLEKPYDFDNLLNILKEAYQTRLKKKFKKNADRLSEIEALSVGSSPLSILRSLRQIDNKVK